MSAHLLILPSDLIYLIYLIVLAVHTYRMRATRQARKDIHDIDNTVPRSKPGSDFRHRIAIFEVDSSSINCRRSGRDINLKILQCYWRRNMATEFLTFSTQNKLVTRIVDPILGGKIIITLP